MTSLASPTKSPHELTSNRFARVAQTATFRDGGFDRWLQATIAVIGAGALGAPLAVGIVRSGAAVAVFDFDVGTERNLGNQPVEVGVPKVDSVVAACDVIRPDRARGFACDIRQAGIGLLEQFDLLIDCSDDPNLGVPLTEISNGLGVPMLRCAVDGSGALELGRVLCSSAASGHACGMCSYGLDDLRANQPRVGCPQPARSPRPATIAGSALAMVISGVGLLAAQRVVTGNDANLVLGRETIIDLNNIQALSIELPRSEACLSGHRRWTLERCGGAASMTTLADVFGTAAERLGTRLLTLEPFLHPLNVRADCDCGEHVDAVGARWAPPPTCPRCRGPMAWQQAIQVARLDEAQAQQLEILDTPLVELGLPTDGAMIVARAPDQPPLRLVIECEEAIQHTLR
jgi:hypothetical protein